MFSKRPNRTETEDDILRQQDEYLRQKGHKLPQNNDQKEIQNEPDETEKNYTKTTLTVNDIGNFNIKIVERDFSLNPEYSMLYANRKQDISQTENGFPVASTLSTYKNSTSTRGPSLYAQKHLMKKTAKLNTTDNTDIDSGIVSGIGLGSEHWKRDIAEIKYENKKTIENMSSEDIDKLRTELFQKLNPKTVSFLQSKKFKYRSEVAKEAEQKAEKMEVEPVMSSAEDVSEKLAIPISQVESNKYVHMNVIEKDKLSWMGDIPQKDLSTDPKKAIDFSARFNFDGDLIDLEKCEEIDVHEGLHHHGEEPERPGYTINELLIYLQSSFPSQKQIGLKVFEKIISKAYQGIYDACFSTNLIEYLLKDTSLALVVRTCLDDTAETVWKSSISTLKAIVCNTIFDEIFLDRGYLIFEDYLNFGFKIDLNLRPILDKEVEIDDQMIDQQYLEYDLVECLLNRTAILERFAYLIKNYLYSEDVVFIEEILEILIRIARHSKEASEAIIDNSDLMDALFSHLVNKNVLMSQCKMVHCKAFKLVRVCVSSIKSSAIKSLPPSLNHLFNRFVDISFIDSLNLSLSLNPEDVPQDTAFIFLKISIESLRTWLKLLSLVSSKCHHNFLEDLKNNFIHMFPSFMKILNFCKNLIPLDCQPQSVIRSTFDFQFASCVFMLIKMYHEVFNQQNDYSQVYSFDLYDIAMRWFTIINSDGIVPDFDTSLCILVLSEFVLKHLKVDDKFINVAFVKLSENDRFTGKLYDLCTKNSNTALLGLETSGTYRDSTNLPSFGSIYFKRSRSVPLLNPDSPICLLLSLIRIASTIASPLQKLSKQDKMFYRLSEFISFVSSNITKDFHPNIFDLIEINIVSQACILIQKDIQHQQHQAHVCKSVLSFTLLLNKLNLNQIKTEIIDNILFNHQFYTFSHYNYSESQFKSFKNTYRKYSNFDDNIWLFHPLLNCTTKQNDSSDVKLELTELLSCLQYLLLVCDTFPQHFDQIGVSKNTLFTLIASAFLVDDSHFFNADVRALLETFLSNLLKSPEGIICSKDDSIPCHGNIVDFFSKFITQFENCSYGDPIFCNYLLIFFQQKCSPHFRNFFLSEHSCLIRVVRLRFDELLLNMECLLFPLETNLETLEIYLKTLLCELLLPEESPVLYCQLIHHLNHALFRDNSPIKEKLFANEDKSEKTRMNKYNFDKLIRSVHMSQDERLKQHLLKYSHFDADCKYGLALHQ